MRERQEPIVITHRDRDVAVLLQVEAYRELERGEVSAATVQRPAAPSTRPPPSATLIPLQWVELLRLR